MYIFRLPAKAYDMDWSHTGLTAFLAAGRDKYRRKVGTTVTVEHGSFGLIGIRLYETVIVYVGPEGMHIPSEINRHITHATREWLRLITGMYVASENFRYNVAGTIVKDRRIVRHV